VVVQFRIKALRFDFVLCRRPMRKHEHNLWGVHAQPFEEAHIVGVRSVLDDISVGDPEHADESGLHDLTGGRKSPELALGRLTQQPPLDDPIGLGEELQDDDMEIRKDWFAARQALPDCHRHPMSMTEPV
jgi:hypothetical protein